MNESYVVTEGDGFVNVTVGVLLGGLGREVIVTLSTQVDTVPGKYCSGDREGAGRVSALSLNCTHTHSVEVSACRQCDNI